MKTPIAAKFQPTHTFDIYTTNPFKMEDYLIQDSELTSGYDAMNFGGDVGQECNQAEHRIQTCPNRLPIGQEGIGHREFFVAGIPWQTRDLVFRAIDGEEL